MSALESWSEGHEALCAERHGGILERLTGMDHRLSRMERIAITVAGAIIVGLAGVLWQVVALRLHLG